MPEPIDGGVKSPAAPAGKEGVNESGAPTAEALEKANKVAEGFRKEKEAATEKLEAMEAELAELKERSEKYDLDTQERKRKALLEAGIEDQDALVAELESEAKSGKRWAQAVLAAIKKGAKEASKETVSETLTKAEFEKNLGARDELLETEAEKHKMSAKEFSKILGEFADESLAANPVKQFKAALKSWGREAELRKREAEIEEFKKVNENFRDGGTESSQKESSKSGKKDWNTPGSWKEAKTQAEKEAALSTI